MLQQILKDMYIQPELLEELSEDQKQILFYKMREEQIRRWKLREEKLEDEDKLKPKLKPNLGKNGKKKVNFLTGKDGCEWVWVMGDHPNDKSIEQILEEEDKAKALKQAEAEAEALRLKEEAEFLRKIQEEKQRVLREKEQMEAEMKQKQQEAELYQSIKQARIAMEQMELEKKKQEEEKHKRILAIERISAVESQGLDTAIIPSPILNSPFLSEEEKRARRRSRDLANSVKDKRSSEIYTSLQKRHQQIVQEAEESQQELETSWQEQEKKAKEAEIKMRENARQARTEYRESLRRSVTLLQACEEISGSTGREEMKPPVPPKRTKKLAKVQGAAQKPVRPSKPENKEMIISWFQEEERDRAGVISAATGGVAIWFHGIISRADAEKLLLNEKKGAFLIRVSERVWGYTLSYRESVRCKHFLIDASETGYQFIGADQVVHSSLLNLVTYYKDNPVTILGQEKLLFPIGQKSSSLDYQELLRTKKS